MASPPGTDFPFAQELLYDAFISIMHIIPPLARFINPFPWLYYNQLTNCFEEYDPMSKSVNIKKLEERRKTLESYLSWCKNKKNKTIGQK
ncbi:hypothetical protein [Desulforamulus ruminis]|nr:hypothetical protein [Desulforamulus ruminis]